MSYQWSIDQRPVQYGVPTGAYAKVYHDTQAVINELYFHELIQGNQLKGFLPIAGYGSTDARSKEFTLFFVGQRLPEGFQPKEWMIKDLTESLLLLAEHGFYYVEDTHGSLFWDAQREQVVLADYNFLDINHPGAYRPGPTFHPAAREYVQSRKTVVGMTPEQVEETRVKLLEVVKDSLMVMVGEVPSYQRPDRVFLPPPITIDEYQRKLTELITDRFETDSVHQRGEGGDAFVRTPPLKCLLDRGDKELVPTPAFPFIGKVVDEEGDLYGERAATELMDVLDPTGRYHARLVRRCPVPTDGDGTRYQHIYEYTGDNLSMVDLDDDESWPWLLLGLRNLFKGVQLLHRHGYVHGDIKPQNITATKFLQLKMIDFGISGPAGRYNVETAGRWHYTNHPVELKMLNNPRVPMPELLRGHKNSHLRGDRGDYFRVVSQEGEDSEQAARYWVDLYQMPARERRRWIVYGTDLYGLGASLIATLPWELLREHLIPVIRHLVVYDLKERSLDLALAKLDEVIDELTGGMVTELDHEPHEHREDLKHEFNDEEPVRKGHISLTLPSGPRSPAQSS